MASLRNLMPDSQNLTAFELGREWKLSLAEIEAIFGAESVISVTPKLAIIETEQNVAAIAGRMGGVIRAFEIVSPLRDAKGFAVNVAVELGKMESETKLSFGLGTIGVAAGIFNQGLRLKKDLRAKDLNLRLVNKNDENLVSAVVKKEGLVASGTEFFLLESERKLYLARTIFIQDIDAYTARDLGKTRDMVVGMLPPKLAQMMINLAVGGSQAGGVGNWMLSKVGLYDPFCGLGTVMIEGTNMGITELFASDISAPMVEATRTSGPPHMFVQELDARKIGDFSELSKVTHIVTEWYLGRIFGQHSIEYKLVEEEKQKLLAMYQDMFASLKKANWKGTIVITIPCWETRDTSVYFGEFYKAAERYGYMADPLLVERSDIKLTKFGSLIYRRPGQTVGREVVRLQAR